MIRSTEETYELMAFELRPPGLKGVNHLKSCGKRDWGNRNSKCKGPEVSCGSVFKDTKASHKAGRSECRVCSRR